MMKITFPREWRRPLPLLILAAGGIGWLMLYHLGSLTGGLSGSEQQAANTAYGWHNLYRQPLYLPLNLLRSIIFVAAGHHGQTLTRLPNAMFGMLTIIIFACLLRYWYGGRTAVLAAVLFACSAWTLHISRLASYDVLYLWAVPALLFGQLALQRRPTQAVTYYGSLLIWLSLLFVPGMIWLLFGSFFWTRSAWLQAWQRFNRWWQRGSYVLVTIVALALLVEGLLRPGNLRRWTGLPQHFVAPLELLKHLGAVPVHLFVRGPEMPVLWLGRLPILDVFTLVMTLLGIYFYATHLRAARSRLLLSYFLLGWLLVGLGGPVSLSLLIPLLYLCAGGGMAFLLREWFAVFPANPIARGLGLGLIIVAVCLSGGYNLRAYFVAWRYAPATHAIFIYKR